MEQHEHIRCLRCGRRLKNPEQRKLGYGPSCYEKVQQTQLKKKSLIREFENDTEATKTCIGK